MIDKALLPKHVGIIMDGNGRWSKKRGLPNNFGHKKGAEVFENISRHCRDIGIPWLTVYAFSTEDLKSRLTSEEIESIKIWAKATRTQELTIVKKIPFAVFIAIGFVSYFVLWGILSWV